MYSTDLRYSFIYFRPGEKKWYLHMNSVQETDRGWYMCQINTDPMVHRYII